MSLRSRITAMFVATTASVGLALIALVYGYLKLTPVPFRAEFPDSAVIDGAVPVSSDILRVMLTASLVSLLVLTVLAGVIGWFVAGWVITPLSSIASTARKVTAGDMKERTGYTGAADELGDVSKALDTMLDTLADSITAQKRFSANASHELKTPISTIQTIADVALAGDNDGELREALNRIREVNAGNAKTVTALLDLARAEMPAVDAVDFGAICRDCGIDAESVIVTGDPVLLQHAVSNLVRNAHTHGEYVSGALTLHDGLATVTVESAGPELSEEEVATFVEPFTGSGHGLGLTLTDSIAASHGGKLELVPRAGGGLIARFSVPTSHPMPTNQSGRPA